MHSVLFGPSLKSKCTWAPASDTRLLGVEVALSRYHMVQSASWIPFIVLPCCKNPSPCPEFRIPAEGRRRLVMPNPKLEKRGQQIKICHGLAFAQLSSKNHARLLFQESLPEAGRRTRQFSCSSPFRYFHGAAWFYQ